MNRKCRLCWFVIAAFLILNVVFISVWLTKREPYLKESEKSREERKEQYKERYRNYVIQTLKLDSVQADAFKSLKNQHARTDTRLSKDLDSLKVKLGLLIFNNESDSSVVTKIVHQIGEIEEERVLLYYKHTKSLRDICREEQKVQFDEMHKKMMSHMRKHGDRSRRSRGD
jgi:hypothetical protein